MHARLRVSSEDFDELVELLRETLEDFDFDESDIAKVYGEVISFRGDVVSSPGATLREDD